MDDIFRIMCDVAGLVTRGSDAARTEAWRVAAERERRAAAAPAPAVADQPFAAAAPAIGRSAVRSRRWLKLAFLSR